MAQQEYWACKSDLEMLVTTRQLSVLAWRHRVVLCAVFLSLPSEAFSIVPDRWVSLEPPCVLMVLFPSVILNYTDHALSGSNIECHNTWRTSLTDLVVFSIMVFFEAAKYGL